MSKETDAELARLAQQRAIDGSPDIDEFSMVLCKACNEPHEPIESNPNDFVADRDTEPPVSQAAFQIEPSEIAYHDPDDVWDRICVYPSVIDRVDDDVVRVDYARHDFESDVYEAWLDALQSIKAERRNAVENNHLDDYNGDRDERPIIGYVVPLPNDRGFVTKCDGCTDEPDDAQGTIRDDAIYGDEVPYPECYECAEVIRPEVAG